MTYLERRLKEINETPAYYIGDRKEKFTKQLLEWGFHDGDTFDLNAHLAELILPRLRRYKELAEQCIIIDFPLDDMIDAFALYVESGKEVYEFTEGEKARFKKGLEAFAKYFLKLWW